MGSLPSCLADQTRLIALGARQGTYRRLFLVFEQHVSRMELGFFRGVWVAQSTARQPCSLNLMLLHKGRKRRELTPCVPQPHGLHP